MTRILAFILIFGFSQPVFANDRKDMSVFNHFKDFILDKPLPRPTLTKHPPHENNFEDINKNSHAETITINKNNATACLTASPHHHYSIMSSAGQTARLLHNNLNKEINSFSFQPRFSGLKGPKITIMRKDLTNALRDHKGSAPEIFHNAQINTNTTKCETGIRLREHIIIHNQVDLYDSDNAPLNRTSIKWRNELNLGTYFMGTASFRSTVTDNLKHDRNKSFLNRLDPIRQDFVVAQYPAFNVDRLMLSGMATPKDTLYIAGHIGYLEEMFAGGGAEILYRPFDKNFAIGAEAWNTVKRTPYTGNIWSTDNANRQQSYLLNAWYDLPETPVSFGASTGRFLDGDMGIEFKTRWTPKPGWKAEGFINYSNEANHAPHNDDRTHVFTGVKLSIPIGRFDLINDQIRIDFDIAPMGRDKGQRIDNPYPLYDYTDPWSARSINRYWNEITD